MTRPFFVALGAGAAWAAFALAQEAPQPANPPADDTEQLAEDFDALFNPAPEPEPTAPVELGPAPSEPPEPQPVEPLSEVGEGPDVTADPEAGEDASTPADEDESVEEEEERVVLRWNEFETATLRGLDKITGRFTDIDTVVGEAVNFGTLRVEVQTCFQTPPDLPPESAAFIRVNTLQPMETEAGLEPEPLVFSGWMFASSPGLNALEHPVYDVWVMECASVELPTISEQ
ncbi:MAG: DUF2155 domain-containing protein [Pseudomonadota bacterium]